MAEHHRTRNQITLGAPGLPCTATLRQYARLLLHYHTHRIEHKAKAFQPLRALVQQPAVCRRLIMMVLAIYAALTGIMKRCLFVAFMLSVFGFMLAMRYMLLHQGVWLDLLFDTAQHPQQFQDQAVVSVLVPLWLLLCAVKSFPSFVLWQAQDTVLHYGIGVIRLTARHLLLSSYLTRQVVDWLLSSLVWAIANEQWRLSLRLWQIALIASIPVSLRLMVSALEVLSLSRYERDAVENPVIVGRKRIALFVMLALLVFLVASIQDTVPVLRLQPVVLVVFSLLLLPVMAVSLTMLLRAQHYDLRYAKVYQYLQREAIDVEALQEEMEHREVAEQLRAQFDQERLHSQASQPSYTVAASRASDRLDDELLLEESHQNPHRDWGRALGKTVDKTFGSAVDSALGKAPVKLSQPYGEMSALRINQLFIARHKRYFRSQILIPRLIMVAVLAVIAVVMLVVATMDSMRQGRVGSWLVLFGTSALLSIVSHESIFKLMYQSMDAPLMQYNISRNMGSIRAVLRARCQLSFGFVMLMALLITPSYLLIIFCYLQITAGRHLLLIGAVLVLQLLLKVCVEYVLYYGWLPYDRQGVPKLLRKVIAPILNNHVVYAVIVALSIFDYTVGKIVFAVSLVLVLAAVVTLYTFGVRRFQQMR